MTLAVLGSFVGLLLAILALVKGVIPAWRWFGRVSSRVSGALDNLGGRAAFVDSATGKKVPAIPPLGERLTGIEETLVTLVDVNARLDAHATRLDGLETTVGAIIADKFEKGAHAALQAVEKAQAATLDAEDS